ncbi:histidine kinase [Halanaerobium sp. Z-7514]|uniref:histidine kinase n=1 Tax=Halanaerobium polyolivorans TaxID=2886943 RepID=A0AAW4WZY9_9FIRM|nr:histidine kinase [Halanaerobium polyolivorans]MCC3144046.1 histidine kinase [Halanaerobium polyolivorans]RQD72861.1 MAG: hypothetical protein D5S01_08825 [Halanaerobium sp. MSAO_Bac5]
MFSRIKGFFVKDKRSIRTRIISVFIIIIIILNLVFFFSFLRREREIEIYQDNVDINFKLNQLSLEITENSRYFSQYFQNRDEETRDMYFNSREKISNLMKDVEIKVAQDQKSRTFYRSLNNMINYHDELVNQVLETNIFDSTTYQTLTRIDTLYSYMSSHSQNLINSYLEHHSRSYMDLLISTQERTKTIYLIIILISIAVFIFSVLFTNNILKAIEKLSSTARYLSLGHWNIEDIEEIRYRELNILGQTFNLMKNNIKKYINELKEKADLENKLNKQKMKNIEKERLLKESQLLNLQMQMDPHFLFNTLNTVSRTAMFENADKTQKLIIAISKIMRYNLDHTGKLVSLEKEIEVLKAYLTIQQTRFEEQMEFDIQIEADISDIEIPPMILQPVVENAIIHGLSDKDSDGKVLIRIERTAKNLKLIIEDNGAGISRAELERILNEEINNNNTSQKDSLGLLNVKRRLKLQYGEDLLSIKTAVNEGTKIIINIPLRKGGN